MKSKEELGFCLFAPGVRFFWLLLRGLLALGVLKNPTYYTADSHNLVFQNISQIQRSKGFQKTKKNFSRCSYSKLCFLQRTPINSDAQRAKVVNEPSGSWVLRRSSCHLVVEDDPEHPSVVHRATYLQHPWLFCSSLAPADYVCSCLSAFQAVQECGLSLGYYFWVRQK